jgi:DNA-binding PadR family transcriptional regulator
MRWANLPRKERLSEAELTDNEGSLLALVLRRQPIKPYRLLKIYEQSPVSSFNESKGNLYPLIRRLIAGGFLAAEAVPDDKRRSEVLRCTDKGRAAVKSWVQQIQPGQVLLNDPLRTKIISFDLLDADQQGEWIARLRAMVGEKIRDIEAYSAALDMPMQQLVVDNAMRSLNERLAWLDEVEAASKRS